MRTFSAMLPELWSVLGVGVAVFIATNVDDIVLIAAFFADPRLRARAVVWGQFAGIGLLVATSAVTAHAALVVPPGYVALLGLIPLGLGLKALWEWRRDDDDDPAAELRVEGRTLGQFMAVTGVTIANGGDNIGAYIPLFAKDPSWIPVYAVVFLLLTGALCLAGHQMVLHRTLGPLLRHHGRVLLPVVLIGLGLWILWDARVLWL